ncbi:MAG TPA: trypsin-like peptidase domain-containing protein [Candidatus Acidoferrum sp.]|jgi:serine protease Do|nr:trypsin-like peptidase domain-containing protein [Candidatus Acidoferrum sp.]
MDHVRTVVDWSRRRKVVAAGLIALTLVVGIMIGTVISGRVSAMKGFAFAGTNATPLALPDPIPSSNSFASIVNRVEPAVVNIATTQVIDRKSRRRQGSPLDPDDPSEDFFFHFFDGRPGAGPQTPQAERSLGSGVILDKNGFILTNNHVIEQATKIQVQLNGDPAKYTAKVIGTDEDTDLAVIRIDAGKDLPCAKLGNSEGVQVGDWVLAIGSPFGLNATVTAGIISAKDRGGMGRQFQRFLQTDAAINPGNSGGPLVDMAGQVIGINTAILTGGRGYEGVGFAMPSAAAISVYDQIVKSGRVTRGSIGVSFQEDLGTNQITLKALGAPYGVVIEGVEPGSPAEKAGLKGGDVISAINGQVVKTGNDLVNPIASAPIGSKVKITYYRDKQQKDTTATVEDRTHVFPNSAGRVNNTPDDAAPTEFGLHVESLTPERAQRVGVEGQKGVLVSEVEPTSFADDVGFTQGDVISEVNGQAVTSVDDYRKAISKLKPGDNVVFKVLRRSPTDRIMTVFLPGVVPADGK